MTAWIILNGERTKFIDKILPKGAAVYCADGGADYLYEKGFIPKVIMGDMDSISPQVKAYYENKNCEFEVFPCEKDETDGQLIVDKVLKDKPDEIAILCGLGGRLDHMMGNFQLLYRIAKQGVTGKIIGDNVVVIMSGKEISIEKKNGQMVSVIPYADETVLSLEGFRYNVEEFAFKKDTPIGISNYVVDDIGKIKVHSGYPMVITTDL